MATYKAIASTGWNVSTTWNEWNGSAWVIPFTSPFYPNTTSDVVYLNTFTPTVNINTVTTGIITNEASILLSPNTTAGGKLIPNVSTTSINPCTIIADVSMTLATSATNGLVDASSQVGYYLVIDSPAVFLNANSPLFSVGSSSNVTLKRMTMGYSGTASTSARMTISSNPVTVTLNNVTSLQTVSDGLSLSGNNNVVTTTNNTTLRGSNSTTTTYGINISTGTSQVVTIEDSTIIAGTASPCIFMQNAASNFVKIKNGSSLSFNSKIQNTNDWMAIYATKVQIDNDITGWDFQPASTAGTTTLSPVAGTPVYPEAKNVLLGSGLFGPNGTNYTPSLTIPQENTVLSGTTYGVGEATSPAEQSTGTLDIPNAVAQVVGNIVANLT
jgi:hypothetical protein